MTSEPITLSTCVVRDTASRKGRTCAVAPGQTASRHLSYGRIILDSRDAPLSVDTRDCETALITLGGEAMVDTENRSYRLTKYDALYVPRDSAFRVVPGSGGCDIAEIAAPVSAKHPVQFVTFADVQRDPGLHFVAGGPSAQRDLNVLIGKNVSAGRLMAGITFSQPGNWTSWPPHEHAAMLEEAYLYVDMPHPCFGVQLVYTADRDPELATIVREGDIVLMPQGYHPNVAAPGSPINFVWMMAANREGEDRQYGVVNVHPDFAALGSGLDKGRSERR
jgi:5-deoxy-glucuronate isomerase